MSICMAYIEFKACTVVCGGVWKGVWQIVPNQTFLFSNMFLSRFSTQTDKSQMFYVIFVFLSSPEVFSTGDMAMSSGLGPYCTAIGPTVNILRGDGDFLTIARISIALIIEMAQFRRV